MSQVFHSANPPTFALIGARGFIGSRLRAIASEREISHVGYTRTQPIVTTDGLDPRAANVSTVVWSASMITPAIAEEDPARVELEQATFQTMVDALERLDDPPRLVVMSSGGTVYGGTNAPFTESDEPNPVNRYGAAKLELERIAQRSSLQTAVLRVANAYGPGQLLKGGQGVIGHWLRALRDGRPIVIFGDGSAVRDYIYVDDIVEAILAVAQQESHERHCVFNVGSGEPTTLTRLAQVCRAIAGDVGEIRYETHRGFDVAANWLDVTAARHQLGWEADTPLREGLARTWEWVRVSA